MTDHTSTVKDQWQQMSEANAATIAQWVEDASGGVFTAEANTNGSFLSGNFSVVRTDGASFDHGGHSCTGVSVAIQTSSVRRIDRRWKVTMNEVFWAVKTAAGMACSSDEERDQVFQARWIWADSNKVKVS